MTAEYMNNGGASTSPQWTEGSVASGRTIIRKTEFLQRLNSISYITEADSSKSYKHRAALSALYVKLL